QRHHQAHQEKATPGVGEIAQREKHGGLRSSRRSIFYRRCVLSTGCPLGDDRSTNSGGLPQAGRAAITPA
ncbi:MAG: hypothetical protein L6Q83_02165, partial [Gammaproteobacteria bacterium]|nr:hypothetical protein [Gammaproteobacteria bacterium]